jgi:hypothetical protein
MATFLFRSLFSLGLGLTLLGWVGAASADADPPARVGRASFVQGDVAYLRDGEWMPLPVNWPVTTGTRLSAAPGARAEVRIGSTAVRLAGGTDLEFAQLDDEAIGLRLRHGTIDTRVRNREVAQSFWVETPEARAALLEAGRYRFDAGVEPDTTAVGADQGSARVEAGGSSIVLRAGKRAEVRRDGDMRLDDAQPDGFDEWALDRDRREDASRSARYVSPEMTGYESLDDHGDWREVPEYGPVWVPRAVPVGWAPYRTGRWAWVEPWGWTWIDEAPWGFAPFHYGRWAFAGGIWMWAPGHVVPRPVYAPALVGWIGRPGWSVSVSIGTVPAVGWFPLAPREVFVPAYRHSTAYVRNVNVAHVSNVTHIANVTNVNYVNRRIDRAVTVVPAAAVTHGQPVARSQLHVRRAELDRNATASPTPPAAAVAPPRLATPQARRDDDRGPQQRRLDPSPRVQEAPRVARPDGRRPELRAQPAPMPSVQTAPATPPRAVETRPEPRQERPQDVQRGEVPRAGAPAAPTPPPVQAQPRSEPIESRPEPRQAPRVEEERREAPRRMAPAVQAPTRTEPRTIESRPQSGQEPRGDLQRMEPPRTVAPAAPTVQAPTRIERRTLESRPESRQEPRRDLQRMEPPRTVAPSPQPQPQQTQPRVEPRRESQRVEPPRTIAPLPPQAQPRPEPRVGPPTPAVRAAPLPAVPAAMPAPQPQQQSAPRSDGNRGQGPQQRRSEGRAAG